MKKFVVALCSLFLLSGCSNPEKESKASKPMESVLDEEGKISKPMDEVSDVLSDPSVKFDDKVLLVKNSETYCSDSLPKNLEDLGAVSVREIAPRSNWKVVTLDSGHDARNSISKFRASGLFEMVDFDYIYENQDEGTATVDSNVPTTVAEYQTQTKIDKAWKWMEDNNHTPGGDSSVVVAVIDTGVDYDHIDLKQNIWINTDEIPNNGIDDDQNGYVDDYYGWNFVGNNNDPMDDNGHGTHVAGIIGAANNDIGVTGVAYNCKIMPVKAGNSSGYFNNSDIASAITYAYMNGADVINMSFGGTSMTMAVQDALEQAYTTSFLVAAAGNDGLPNEPHPYSLDYETVYPASLPYVDGVMSVNANNVMSSFTNWDPYKENKIEYECMAPGEAIQSTFPGNRYASLSGTSMAAPVVSGIAALLRSVCTDKSQFSTKYLMSQIINTSETSPIDFDSMFGPKGNGKAKVVDAYNMFTKVPSPDVSLYDWYTFDNVDIDPTHNNGNDNIDAGETIHIGTELLNRGGMAKDVVGKIDVSRLSSDIVDPYVTIVTDTVNYSDIGTYSIRDAEKVMNSDTIVDVKKPFVIKVAENAPNNYKCDINIHITWKNGLDPNDTNTYSYDSKMTLDFHRGVYLPSRIDEDTTLTADKLWIVADTVRIGEGVTVNVDPGTTIQFYSQNQSKYQYATPMIKLTENSKLLCNGTEDKMINFTLAEGYEDYVQEIESFIDGKQEETQASKVEFKHVSLKNMRQDKSCIVTSSEGWCLYYGGVKLDHCILQYYNDSYFYKLNQGQTNDVFCSFEFDSITSSKISTQTGNSGITLHGSEMLDSAVVFYKGGYRIDTFRNRKNNYYVIQPENYYGESSLGCLDTIQKSDCFIENHFINNSSSDVLKGYPSVGKFPIVKNNTFHGYPEPFIDRTFGDTKNEISGTASIEDAWPFVSGYQFTNDKGEETTKFSKENMNLKLIFNRAMDTTQDLSVTFGSVEPYGDYKINGSWTDSSTWVGKCEIPTAIENGTQHLRITGGRADSDHFLTNEDNGYRITFDIDTTSAMSMNMDATPSEDGILLRMNQDDYSTIMGYNVYRSEQADGEYARINTAVIRPDSGDEQTASYLDKTVEPGKTYYYSYTAVMTDFSESKASGRTSATALDTINPIIAHTPVNQGYLGSNLNINCTITDNVRVTYANLYYRVKGEEEYKVVSMTHSNNKYSGFIPAADLSLDGMQYYIETSDGTNVVTVGSKDSPYTVVIKESSAVSYLGDVDGNGVIEAVDAMLVLQHINGKRVLVNEEFSRADLDGNKKLETFEALAILQYINGSRTNLDIEA